MIGEREFSRRVFSRVKEMVEGVTYDENRDELIIKFKDTNSKLKVNYTWAYGHPKQFGIKVRAFIFRVYHIEIMDTSLPSANYLWAKDFVRWLIVKATESAGVKE